MEQIGRHRPLTLYYATFLVTQQRNTMDANNQHANSVIFFMKSVVDFDAYLSKTAVDYTVNVWDRSIDEVKAVLDFTSESVNEYASSAVIAAYRAMETICEMFTAEWFDISKLQLACVMVILFLLCGIKRQTVVHWGLCKDLKMIGGLMRHNRWQKEATSKEMQEVTNRLARNRNERTVNIVKKIEKVSELFYLKSDLINQLNSQMDFLCPVVMQQERKLRMVNKAWENETNCIDVEAVRNVGREVDEKLMDINLKLGKMALHIKRELEFAGRIAEV